MAWLTSLLKKPEATESEEPQAEIAQSKGPAGPQLAVLEPDIAGISSFRLNLFPDSAAAAEHMTDLRAEVRRGSHVFWAMQHEPATTEPGQKEALVLIRADNNSELVYVVSFLDIESALSFTRFEVRRGLNLHNVMIYWAAWAQVREELEGLTVLPSSPPAIAGPRAAAQDTVATVEEHVPVAEQPVADAVFEADAAAAEADAVAEAEALAEVERYLQAKAAEPESVAKAETVDTRAFEEPTPVVDALPAAAEAEIEDPLAPTTLEPEVELAPPVEAHDAPVAEHDDFEPEGWPPPMPARADAATDELAASVAEAPIEAEILQSEIPEEEAALDEAVVFQHRVVLEPPAEPVPDLADVVPPDFLRQPHLSVHGEELPVVEEIAEPQLMDAVADGLLITEADEEEAISGLVHAIAGDEEIQDLAPPLPAAAEIELPAGEPESFADAADEPVQSYPGDEEAIANALEAEMAVADALEADVAAADALETDVAATNTLEADPGADEASGLAAPQKLDEFDVAYEVERLLNRRRFDKRDSPFTGFESPPGRF